MSVHPYFSAPRIAYLRRWRFLPILAFIVVLVSALPAVADATWQPLGALSSGTGPVDEPQVAVDASGDAVYVWEISEGTLCSGGPCERIQTRSRSAAGVLSPVQTISTQGQSQSLPHVAVDANGDAWFVWQHFDGTIERIQTRSRSAAGVWTGTATVSPPGGSAEFPQVAVDPSGNAVFTWEYFDGTHWRIQARTVSLAGTRSST
jgi:DNA-binding beta-propeller fold protein YncE